MAGYKYYEMEVISNGMEELFRNYKFKKQNTQSYL